MSSLWRQTWLKSLFLSWFSFTDFVLCFFLPFHNFGYQSTVIIIHLTTLARLFANFRLFVLFTFTQTTFHVNVLDIWITWETNFIYLLLVNFQIFRLVVVNVEMVWVMNLLVMGPKGNQDFEYSVIQWNSVLLLQLMAWNSLKM